MSAWRILSTTSLQSCPAANTVVMSLPTAEGGLYSALATRSPEYCSSYLQRVSRCCQPVMIISASHAQGGPSHCDRESAGERAHFRQLDPAKLSAIKQEFAKVEKESIIWRSSSCRSSPLHMVMKEDRTIRVHVEITKG